MAELYWLSDLSGLALSLCCRAAGAERTGWMTVAY